MTIKLRFQDCMNKVNAYFPRSARMRMFLQEVYKIFAGAKVLLFFDIYKSKVDFYLRMSFFFCTFAAFFEINGKFIRHTKAD